MTASSRYETRPAGDGERGRVEQIADLGKDSVQPTGSEEVVHQEPAGRLQVDQQRYPGTGAIEVVLRQLHAEPPCDREQVHHGVGGAANRGERDDRVEKGRAGEHGARPPVRGDRVDGEHPGRVGRLRHFEDDSEPFTVKPQGFRLLDRVVDACARHGIYTILDLHAVPGAQNQHWHSDNPTQWASFWAHRHFQDRVVHLWEHLAEHYRGNPWVAGYNPVNEPADAEGSTIGPFYRRLEAAIRAVDPDHILFLDGNRYSTQFDQLGDPLPNTVYTAHDYALPGFVDGGPYPGVSRGVYVDRDQVEETFLARTAYMRETGTPIWIGEFGPVYTGDPGRDEMRYRLLQDQLEIFARHNASWALWTYKDIGLQDVAYARPDSEYLRTIAPVVAKKARLGVDSWGATDKDIRHIMQPIEDVFAREFPAFAPYPWGAKRWIAGHVRHVMLAEAMVDEFAGCFAGVDLEEAERLADAFAFANCQVRAPLADILTATVAARM